MSDIASAGLGEKGQDEKLGAYIRRARLAAKIEVNDLARKIRISPDVLHNIEESKWDAFPVEAYIRGYLNSICIHLELDRNKVLGWFGSEYSSDYVMPVQALRDIGVTQPAVSQGSNSKLIPALIVILIVVFFVVMNLLRKSDKDSVEPIPAAPDTQSVQELPPPVTTDTLTDSVANDSLADTASINLLPPAVPTTDTLVKKVSADTVAATKSTKPGKETNIKLECLKDSVWVRIKRTGEKTKTYQIKEGSPRFFSHTDTIKVRIAAPERTRLYIDEERVRFRDNKDLTIYNGKLVRAEP